MNKGVVWGIIGSLVVLSLASLVWAEEEYVVNNPNYDAYIKAHPLETKPRDANVVAAEKKLLVEAAQAVVDYAKANGVDQAAAEITKNLNGAFAQYCQIWPQFRIMLYQFTNTGPNGEAGDFVILKGHNLWLPMVGGTYPVEMFADLSGWQFLREERKIAFSATGKGWVQNVIWRDEFWANNKIVRSADYDQVIDREQGFVAMACILLDE